MTRVKILLIIFIVVAIIIATRLISHFLIYNPTDINKNKYKSFMKKIELLTETADHVDNKFIKTKDNIYLDTLYLKNPDNDKCIIYLHGESGNITTRYNTIKFLYNYASVMVFDYRAYGRSEGSMIRINCNKIVDDSLCILEYVINNLGYKHTNITLYGESLGCCVAIYMAARLSIGKELKLYPKSIILNYPIYGRNGIGILNQIISYFLPNEYYPGDVIRQIDPTIKIIIANPQQNYPGLWLYSNNIDMKNLEYVIIDNYKRLSDEYIYKLADLFN